ncbi:MAG: arylsulfotransferase family protein, partial [Acidimicrobiales bacterium]
ELIFDWACYPAVHPRLSYARPFGDYFHINSIDLWPGPERNLLISSRNTSAVYLVGRRTGRVLWRLGGKRSDFSIDPDARFWFQHDARALADGSGLSLFDDASQPCPEQYASGKVIALDGRPGSAELRHRYLHTDHNLDVPSQGNCQLLPGGGHLVGWGYLPFFSIYGPSGDSLGAPLILDGRLPDGVASYRTFLFDWVGRPSQSELSLVVRQSGGRDRFTAWVSWNGATEVAAWRLYAGRSAGSLEAVATVRRRGFETEIDFTRIGARDFLVSALDQQGREIGRSRTVAEHDAPGFAHIDSSRATSRHPTRLPKRPDT